MVETLRSQASCALFFSAEVCMLFYPSDSGLDSWEFLNERQPPIPEGASLRYMLRKPLPLPRPEHLDMPTQSDLVKIREGESNLSMVLRVVLGIEYDRLIKQTNPKMTGKSNNFFLFFIGVERERRIITRFLEEHGANIYCWDTEGAWDYFSNHVDAGVILVSSLHP